MPDSIYPACRNEGVPANVIVKRKIKSCRIIELYKSHVNLKLRAQQGVIIKK